MLKIDFHALAAILLSAPALALAAPPDKPVDRAEARAHLVALEQAGFQPAGANINYPVELRRAERRIARDESARQAGLTTADVAMP